MSAKEIGEKLVAYCKEGKNAEAVNELYADNIVSIEAAASPAADMPREMNGKEAILPVSDEVRHWHASPRSAVGFLLHAAGIDGNAVGNRRNLTMPGISVTVGQQIAALRSVAGDEVVGRIRREPDEKIMRMVSGWPRNFRADRATALGFQAERSFETIIQAHNDDERCGNIS